MVLLEKIYNNKLVQFLDGGRINRKFGRRKSHSRELAMIAVKVWAKKFDKGWFTVIVLIDLGNAFDSVHKEKLLEKLMNKYRISDFWLRS